MELSLIHETKKIIDGINELDSDIKLEDFKCR